MPETFADRAKEALDDLGWADSSDAMAVVRANMQLARLVVDMAVALDRLSADDSEPSDDGVVGASGHRWPCPWFYSTQTGDRACTCGLGRPEPDALAADVVSGASGAPEQREVGNAVLERDHLTRITTGRTRS